MIYVAGLLDRISVAKHELTLMSGLINAPTVAHEAARCRLLRLSGGCMTWTLQLQVVYHKFLIPAPGGAWWRQLTDVDNRLLVAKRAVMDIG